MIPINPTKGFLRNSRPFITTLCLTLILCYPFANTQAQTAEPPEFYFDEDQYPFAYSEQGEAKGLYPEIVQAVADILQIKIVLKATPWKRALLSALETHHAVAGLYKTQPRLEKYHYSEPIYTEKIVVVAPLSWQKSFTTIEDFRAYRIGLNSGWSYGKQLDQAFATGQYTLEYGSSPTLVLKKLQIGRSDIALNTELNTLAFLNSDEADATLHILEHALSHQDTYLASGQSAENLELINTFNLGLKQLKQQGKYSALIKAFKEKLTWRAKEVSL